MALVLDAFIDGCIERLATLVEEKAVMKLGVKDGLTRLLRRMETFKYVVEYAQMRSISEYKIDYWVQKLKDIMYDIDGVIIDCTSQSARSLQDDQPSTSSAPPPRVHCSFPLFSCFTNIGFRHEIGDRIKSINEKLDEISEDRSQYSPQGQHVQQFPWWIRCLSSPIFSESDVVGTEIEDATKMLVEVIVGEDVSKRYRVFATVGTKGIGKTILAQKIFKDQKIQAEFTIKLWMWVSENFSATHVLKQIFIAAQGSYEDAATTAELQLILASAVSGKHVFLILDDVWQADVWLNSLQMPIQSAASASILITTRNKNVARKMGVEHIHRVKELPVNDGWVLLCKSMFRDHEDDRELQRLRDIGIQVVEKCHGLPSAINQDRCYDSNLKRSKPARLDKYSST